MRILIELAAWLATIALLLGMRPEDSTIAAARSSRSASRQAKISEVHWDATVRGSPEYCAVPAGLAGFYCRSPGTTGLS